MRLELLSDIHRNLQALDACMEHARAKGVWRRTAGWTSERQDQATEA